MALQPGSRLGSYDITAAVGAGGMGEVYRARDSRLGREVAIKVLPQEFASDSGRMARFEREARVASSLNHPNIITIHDVGRDDGTAYIVMELVPGKSLRSSINQSQPLQAKLKIATQIADGLAAAHAAGIIHRDLKPENIMITPQGTAKILDFGLAKGAPVDDRTEQMISRANEVYGTAAYMSPEQAAGGEVDFRTDQYSFGLILKEMIRDAPPPLSWIIERCLEKDPAKRYASTNDLVRDLEQVEDRRPRLSSETRQARAPVVHFVVIAVLLMAVVALLLWRRAAQRDRRPAYVALYVPEVATLPLMEVVQSLAISPDGRRVAITGVGRDGKPGLWLRDLASPTATRVAGVGLARMPVWSPDGRHIVYLGEGKLNVITPGGGPPRALVDPVVGTTMTWTPRGDILFNNIEPSGIAGIFSVSSAGGPIKRITTVDVSRKGVMHLWPEALPGGNRFLFVERAEGLDVPAGALTLKVGSLDDGQVRDVGPITSRVLVRGGNAYYVRDATLFAQKFDLDEVAFKGEPVPVADGFYYFHSTGNAEFSVATDGTVCLRTARGQSRVVVLNRQGQQTAELARGMFGEVRISPDGRRVAVTVMNPGVGTSDIWAYDLLGKPAKRITFEGFDERWPVWSRDGRSLFYRSDILGPPDILRVDIETNKRSVIAQRPGVQFPNDVSPDGTHLLMQEGVLSQYALDLVLLPLIGEAKVRPFLSTPFDEFGGRIAPSGRWVAFTSNMSGQQEVYVIRFSGEGSAQIVSTSGGSLPRWTNSGRELVYLATPTDLMTIAVNESEFSEPKLLLRSPYEIADYDVTPDGTRVIVRTRDEETAPPIQLVLNAPKP